MSQSIISHVTPETSLFNNLQLGKQEKGNKSATTCKFKGIQNVIAKCNDISYGNVNFKIIPYGMTFVYCWPMLFDKSVFSGPSMEMMEPIKTFGWKILFLYGESSWLTWYSTHFYIFQR